MSKFYSTVSRRDFMKGLGLAGAGLGAVAAVNPVFHDIDEVIASPDANYKQPWYVKELEFEKPSVNVDWPVMLDNWNRTSSLPAGTNAEYDTQRELRSLSGTRHGEVAAAGFEAGTPGYALRDRALASGGGGFAPSTTSEGPNVTTPADRDVANWSGTKEEATNMLRAAAHAYGAAKIGAMDITTNIRKISRTSTLDNVPSECKWILLYLVGQPTEITKKGTTRHQYAAQMGYSYGPIIKHRLQKFIKSLGYHAIASSVPSQNVAAGALAGTGELCRISHQITHEWGPVIRYTPSIITDLPLAPTKPIDAGLFRFCRTCKICADSCLEFNGTRTLSQETDPSYDVSGPWNRQGVEAFQIYWPSCRFCPYCQGSCPFGGHRISGIHDIVLAVQSTTSIFNGFFTNMEKVFGYGLHDTTQHIEDWWNRDLTTWKHDTIFR